jgi:hypothetical protein
VSRNVRRLVTFDQDESQIDGGQICCMSRHGGKEARRTSIAMMDRQAFAAYGIDLRLPVADHGNRRHSAKISAKKRPHRPYAPDGNMVYALHMYDLVSDKAS